MNKTVAIHATAMAASKVLFNDVVATRFSLPKTPS